MHASRFAALAVILAAMSSVACGSSSQSTPSATPTANASLFTTSDFTARIPDGWSDQTTNESAVTAVSVNGTMLMLLIPPASFASRASEHIDVSMVQQPVANDALSGYLQTVSLHGATNVSPVQAFNLDHASGLFVTYTLSAGGATNKAQDMVINHNNNTYDIVLNTAASDFDAQMPALQEILNTWRWTS